MIAIDLLIQKRNEEIKLSDLGLLVQDIESTSPGLEVDFRSVKNRSGRIISGTRFSSKTVEVTGTFVASSLFQYEKLKDEVNALILDEEAYFITKMFPVENDLYSFQTPGESTDDLDLMSIEHEPYFYRYKVTSTSGIETSFQGKSDAGMLFRFSMEFITAELPFGETVPENVTVNGNIPYKGTAKNSQLEFPWTLRLTSTVEQSGTFFAQLQGRLFEHASQTLIKAGDVFLLKGIETRKNGINVNHYTNQEHFILYPTTSGINDFETSFVGKVEILNFVEFYK